MEIQRVLIKSLNIIDKDDVQEIEKFVSKVFVDTRKYPKFAYGPKNNTLAISTSRLGLHDVDDFLTICNILEHEKVYDFIMNSEGYYLYEWLHQDNIRKIVPYKYMRVAKLLICEATWSRKMNCWYVVLNEPISNYDKWYIF